MAKIEINKVAEIIKRKAVEPHLLREIVEEMQMATQPEADEEKAPPVKKQFCIVISDPEGALPQADFVGWVLQIPEEESVSTVLERVHRAAYEFNTTKRGRLMPVKTVGEAFEHVATKHFKEASAWVKTKEPVLIVKTNNLIPTEETDRRVDHRTSEDALVAKSA